jgi:hypothetical protein
MKSIPLCAPLHSRSDCLNSTHIGTSRGGQDSMGGRIILAPPCSAAVISWPLRVMAVELMKVRSLRSRNRLVVSGGVSLASLGEGSPDIPWQGDGSFETTSTVWSRDSIVKTCRLDWNGTFEVHFRIGDLELFQSQTLGHEVTGKPGRQRGLDRRIRSTVEPYAIVSLSTERMGPGYQQTVGI